MVEDVYNISWNQFIDLCVPTHSQLRTTGGFGNKNTHLLLHFTVNWPIIFGFRYWPIRNRSNLFIYNLTSPGLIHQTQPNMIWAMISSFLVTVLGANGDCSAGRKCQRISLNVYQDAVQDSEFVDHVFQNSVTLNPIQCYMKCIQDCRCLSFNLKEKNAEKYCELNEGNHFTNKSSLKQSPGSRYYILRRDYGSEGT